MSVGIKDCEVQTFRCGGKGGQNKDKRDTGVRVIHRPSGARGESREARTQHENKRKAFVRMAESPEMKSFLYVGHSRLSAEIDAWVDEQMQSDNLLVETYVP